MFLTPQDLEQVAAFVDLYVCVSLVLGAVVGAVLMAVAVRVGGED